MPEAERAVVVEALVEVVAADLAEAAEVSEEVEAGSAVAADKKFSSMNRPFAHILSPYLKKGGSFV